MRAFEFLIEAPIMRPAGSYDPNPNDAYHTATTNTTPKYDVDYENSEDSVIYVADAEIKLREQSTGTILATKGFGLDANNDP